MKPHRFTSHAAWMLFALALIVGCSKAANNATTGGAAASASALASGMSIYNQLGGSETVKQLVGAFGVNIAKSPTLSKVFDAAAIAETQLGLTNEIAKASGLVAPNPGVDLATTLSGKGLDAAGFSALSSALGAAADELKLPKEQKNAVVGLLTPITAGLAGGKK